MWAWVDTLVISIQPGLEGIIFGTTVIRNPVLLQLAPRGRHAGM